MQAPPPFEPRRARITMRRRWLLWTSMALIAVNPIQTLFHMDLASGVRALLLGVVGLTVVRYWPVRREGLLGVDAQGLALDGAPLVAASAIGQAVRFGRTVRIDQRRKLPLELELPSDDDAQALLEALAKDERHATAAFFALRGGAARQRRVLLAYAAATTLPALASLAFMSPHHFSAWLFCAFSVPTFLVMLGAPRRMTVTVGADGVTTESAARFLRASRTFYPYSKIQSVRLDDDVVLTLDTGKTIRLGVAHDGKEQVPYQIPVQALHDRIRRARELYVAGGSSSVTSALARGDRETAAWLRSLRELLATPATYRTAAISAATLWSVVEDPTERPNVRVGAAVALRAAIDEEGQARLRVATAANASKELRDALEAASRDDEAALENAMTAIEEAETKAARRVLT
jgi:hypothetical protein